MGVMIKDKMTDIIADFLDYTVKHLPCDITARLSEMRAEEDDPAVLSVYETMFRNMELAEEMGRPLCQDTGIMQFWVRCGSGFPLLGEIESILTDAVLAATGSAPLRPNCVETFDEYNTGNNIGTGAPVIWWDIVPGWDGCEIYTYPSGGGCSLPGRAEVFMPGQGYDAVVPFVLDRITSHGLNACPPLFVGVGIGMSCETAALNSKKALMRSVFSSNENTRAARLEKLLEDGINSIGIGPQGFGGMHSVYGVNIVNTVRHPATLAVAVGFGCWCHRRGRITFDSNLGFCTDTHPEFRQGDAR